MFFAIITVPLLAVFATGGFSETVSTLSGRGDGFLNPGRSLDGQPISIIAVISLLAWGMGYFGATFGPLVLMSLYWKRMTRKGAIAGIFGGGITVLLWKQLSGGLFDLYEIVPGFIVSIGLIVLHHRFF